MKVFDQMESEKTITHSFKYGIKRWYKGDLLHRTDGPAVEKANGTKEWWVNGERHREDGPAVERRDGTKEWWYKGVSQEEIQKTKWQFEGF